MSPEASQATCHECGQTYLHQQIPRGATARCTRCATVLYRNQRLSFDKSLAYTMAAVILFIVANYFPFLGFGLPGNIRQTTLITGSIELFQQGELLLSFIVVFTTVVAPAFQLLLLLYVLIPVNLGHRPREIPNVLKVMIKMGNWGMMDVFMLGILVSVVKLAGMASVVPGPALIAFIVLIFMLAGAQAAFDTDRIWAMVKPRSVDQPTGKVRDFIECHICHFSMPFIENIKKSIQCSRCQSPLYYRKPDSLQRTSAFVIAAIVCFVPANVLPIMKTTSLGAVQPDTIMSGIIYLYSHGSWPLALIVLVASVLVPLVKIAILVYLLISVKMRSQWRPKERTRLYQLAELVGKWSMVDIYVVTILVALVQLGNLASIQAGAGALFFSAVVILTIFAANSFDPRLIWDNMEDDYGRQSQQYA